MNWRQRIADWITGGELTFHREAAVKALAEMQRASITIRGISRIVPRGQGWTPDMDCREMLYDIAAELDDYDPEWEAKP